MRSLSPLRDVLLPAIAALVVSLSLVGCGDDAATTNAINARSDAQLQALADTAWTEALYTGQTATLIDDTNADGVGGAVIGGTDLGLTAGPASVALGASPQAVRNLLDARVRNLVAAVGSPSAARLVTQVVPIDEPLNCPSGGLGHATGTFRATAEPDVNPTFIAFGLDNLTFTFSQCSDSVHEVTGSILFNVDDTISASQTGPNSGTIAIHWDEYMDGGLAIHELPSGPYYNPVFRYTALGTVTITVVGSTVTAASGSVTVTMRLNNVSCVATVDFNGYPSAVTGTSTCTVS